MKEITAFRNYLNEGLDKKDDKVEENIEEVDTHSEDEDVASNFKEGKMTKQALKEKIKAEILSTLKEADEDEIEDEIEDVDVDIDVEAPAETSSEPGLTSDEMEIQNSLKRAYDTAVSIGDEKLSNQIANSIITIIRESLDINLHEMNQDVFLGKLQQQILEANGVINVISIKVFNKVGGQYSSNTIAQAITDTTTGEIKIENNTIYSTQDSMFEIKYPEKDITVLLRKSVV